jgi:hypothetical protein
MGKKAPKLPRRIKSSSVYPGSFRAVFGNGLSINGCKLLLLAESFFNKNAPGYNPVDETGSIPTEQVNEFKNDPLYRTISTETEVFMYPDEHLPYRCFCKNIFQNNVFSFRIIVSETTQPLKQSDRILLDYLSGYLHSASQHFHILKLQNNSLLATLIKNSLDGVSEKKSDLPRELMRKAGTRMTPVFVMLFKP